MKQLVSTMSDKGFMKNNRCLKLSLGKIRCIVLKDVYSLSFIQTSLILKCATKKRQNDTTILCIQMINKEIRGEGCVDSNRLFLFRKKRESNSIRNGINLLEERKRKNGTRAKRNRERNQTKRIDRKSVV